MSHELPEFAYLVTVETEWPVSAIAGDHSFTPLEVEREVARRMESANVHSQHQVRIWRVKLCDVTEMELAVTRPSVELRERQP